jgi:uncharacterized protein
MKLTGTSQELYEAISLLPVIDAHEHLPPEREYLEHEYSGLNLFAGGYIWHDLESAGLSSEFKATMRDGGRRPVSEWWPKIKPYWQHVQHASYARALLITARDIFGLPVIDDTTISELSEAVIESNQPGLYHRILRERCGIRSAITCVGRPDFPDDPILKGITYLEKSTGTPEENALALSERVGRKIQTLDETIEVGQSILWDDIKSGAVGFKMMAANHASPSLEAAEKDWKDNRGRQNYSPAVSDLLFDRFLDVAAEADVPVAVHTGVWGDFRELDPKHLLSFAIRRRDVRFDLFHLGMPMIRDAIMIGKNLPNVTLNLTWCPLISQAQTVRALDEMIDQAPLNKIIAFGGDYRVAVQKVYGHLVMAREVVAEALGRRVDAGDFDQSEALRIARMWFYDNPARIYKIDCL